jgi:DNA-binding transcriptional LysR family regulator
MVWDDLRVFLAVQRAGSHKRGARHLRVDPTTVGRRVAALESALGARLFLRTPEGLRATPAGLRLVPHAERMEAEALEAERTLLAADTRLEGSLRVTAGDGFVHFVLLPALPELRREHPLLCIELRAETRILDLSRREADVALRLVRPKEPALIARRLGRMQLAFYAGQGYLDRRGSPRGLAALAEHDLIGFDSSLDDLPQTKWLLRVLPRPRYVVRATTTSAQVQACADGHGIALLPTFVASREPRLVRLLPRLAGPTRDMWGVIHADMRGSARITTFLAWLARLVSELEA